MSGIYMIVNRTNYKTYIGSTQNSFEERWKAWRGVLNSKVSYKNTYIQNAWNKYGKDKFEFVVLEQFPAILDKREVAEAEQWYFDNFKTHTHNKGGYNIAKRAAHPRRKYPQPLVDM